MLTENELDNWVRGHAREAQALIVDLVARLTAAASPYPSERRFPLGDSIGQQGADGFLRTEFGYDPFVPGGASYWEIGTGVNAGDKATSDYRELTEAIPEPERTASAFLFVTPLSGRRDWPDTWKEDAQSRWVQERRERGEWASVHVIDGTRLVDWLQRFPGVERWLLRQMGLPGDEISSILERWDELRTIGAPPYLAPQLFLANRELAVEQVRSVFNGNYQQLRIDTLYPDQVPDFVAAHAGVEPTETQPDLVGAAVIVSSPEAMRALLHLPDRHIFVPDFDVDGEELRGTRLLERARRGGHAVIYGGVPGGIPHPNRVTLANPKQHDIQAALEAAGYSRERARTLAVRSGTNLSSLLRALQNLSLLPEWAESGEAADLAVATLLGSWSDANPEDVRAAEGISGNAYGEWIANIRSVALRAGTPLNQRNGIWRSVSRYESWYALGPRIFDDLLARFETQALSVLGEVDPKFDLPAAERFTAPIQGKITAHSRHLRHGMTETIALLGSHGVALSSASPGAPSAIAHRLVRQLLQTEDWRRWASLEPFLPLLAEGAPDAFLDSVEAALVASERPFERLFSEESSVFEGGTLISGLLWALESLAWNPDYFVRVLAVLAELAERDPGGSWSNRPANSLSTILRPWLPQTTASPEQRSTSLRLLVRGHSGVAWELLKDLLPSPHQISSGTHRPTWRPWIPEDWTDGVTVEAYRDEVRTLVEMATDLARNDLNRLRELVARLDELPPDAADELLDYLTTDRLLVNDPGGKAELWAELVDIVNKHRRFADANWAMPTERVDRINEVAQQLAPVAPSLKHRRIFGERDYDLFESKDDFAHEREVLADRRREAVREVVEEGGIQAVIDMAHHVHAPGTLGVSLGEVGDETIDREILPGLINQPAPAGRLAGGYVWARFRSRGWPWIEALGIQDWEPEDAAQLLAFLPFDAATWRRAAALGQAEPEFWRRTTANPFEITDGFPEAVRGLIAHERARAAVRALAAAIHSKQEFDPELAAETLLAAVRSNEPVHQSDSYDLVEVIKALQRDPRTDKSALFSVEWAYLSLLDRDRDAQPKLLERMLAEEPSFFLDVIRTVFRPSSEASTTNSGASQEPTDDEKAVARNAYELLHQWRRPPGTADDGTFDPAALRSWWQEVRQSAEESGHREIAETMLGHVLAYAPPEDDREWLNRGVAELLNERDSTYMRQGFRLELYNSRGAHFGSRGLEEEKLAQQYFEKAQTINNLGLHRLAAEIRGLAETYSREAAEEADRALFEE